MLLLQVAREKLIPRIKVAVNFKSSSVSYSLLSLSVIAENPVKTRPKAHSTLTQYGHACDIKQIQRECMACSKISGSTLPPDKITATVLIVSGRLPARTAAIAAAPPGSKTTSKSSCATFMACRHSSSVTVKTSFKDFEFIGHVSSPGIGVIMASQSVGGSVLIATGFPARKLI